MRSGTALRHDTDCLHQLMLYAPLVLLVPSQPLSSASRHAGGNGVDKRTFVQWYAHHVQQHGDDSDDGDSSDGSGDGCHHGSHSLSWHHGSHILSDGCHHGSHSLSWHHGSHILVMAPPTLLRCAHCPRSPSLYLLVALRQDVCGS